MSKRGMRSFIGKGQNKVKGLMMAISEKDRTILRELAAEVADIAALPIQQQKADRWRRLNQLEHGKPMVWINEIPWHEMGPEVELETSNEFCRQQERWLRHILYQWKHMRCDMVVEPKVFCPLVFHDTGFGIEADIVNPDGDTGFEDVYTITGSSHFEPMIKNEEDIEKIQMPQVEADWEATERNYELLLDIFGDILPVEKRGIGNGDLVEGWEDCFFFWFAPWDWLVQWFGVEETFTYLITRPKFVHQVMERLVDAWLCRLDQYEKLNILTLNNGSNRVGSGGFGFTDELPQADFDGTHIRTIDMWGFSAAQIFVGVSPEMHEEFALQHERRWLERFGLTYYGCCEPLHRKIHILESIPNVRKISISPWADREEAASAMGDKYVISLKPNPAVLAAENWNPEAARAELCEDLEKTKGCVVEVIMKDISTCRNEPRRLWEWADIAMEVTERFV